MDNTEQSREELLEQILDDIAKDPPEDDDQEWQDLMREFNTVIEEYKRNKPLHCKPKDAWKPRNIYGGRV